MALGILDIFVGDNLRTFMGRVKEMKFTRDISVGIIA